MIDMCLSIEGDRFEYKIAMLIEAVHRYHVSEETIHTVYYEENKGTHFRPFKDSFRIYRVLFQTFFRYIGIALSSFLIDIILFTLCNKMVLPEFLENIHFQEGEE